MIFSSLQKSSIMSNTTLFKGIWQYIFILAYQQEPLK